MPTASVRRIFSATAFAVLAAPSIADAATYNNGSGSSNFDVTMTIVANCVIASTALDFGQTRGVLGAAINANSTLNVTCTNTTPYNIGLSAGSGTGSLGTTRYLSAAGGNTATVLFNLFQSAGANPWGNTQGTNTVGGTGTGAAQVLTVYGEVPAQATPAPDAYRSTITATVYF